MPLFLVLFPCVMFLWVKYMVNLDKIIKFAAL
jgi:hypothetical protein